jgi:hypothetical protein
MKKILLALFSVISIVFFTQLSNENAAHGNSSGSPNGYTGSPLEFGGRTCGTNGCHGGGTTFQTNMITSNIPSSGYVPGQTYQITATIVFAGRTKFGFQLSPQRQNGTTAGTLIGNAQVQITGSQRYATHTSGSNTGSGSRSWTFSWTAPAVGTGNVTFYAAFNAANNQNNTSGDLIFSSSLVVTESILDIIVDGEPEICENESVTLTSSIETGNQWFLNGAILNGETGQTIDATQGGTYSVSNGGQSAQVEITLLNPPTIPNITSSNAQNLLCNGGSLTLTTDATEITQWSTGVFASSIQVNQPGTYFVIASNACGSVNSANVVVTSATTPSVPTISVSGPTTFCQGNNNTSLSINPVVGQTFTWNPGNVIANSISPIASGNYTVTASNACGSATSQPVSITVNALPPTPIISANGPNTICEGTILTLTATPALNTVWQPTNENGNTIEVGLSGSFVAVNSNSCGTANSLPFNLVVNNQPAQPVIEGQLILENYCEGDSILLQVQLAPGDSAVWFPSNTSGSTTIADQTGTYSVQVFSSCGSATSAGVPLTFLAIPETPIVVLTNDTLFATETTANQYQWLKDGVGIPGATGSFYVPTENGLYSVQAINSGGFPCISNSSNQVNVVINSIQKSNKLAFSIFPNPTSDYLQLQLNFDDSSESIQYEILDLQGRSIQKSILENNTPIPVSHLKNGVYQFILLKKDLIGRTSFIRL